MNDTKNGQPDDAGLSLPEALLPWYATGRLAAEDQALVEGALTEDTELQRRLALIRDEEAETIAVNESLGMPSGATMDRLMARIDAYEAAHPRRVSISERALGRIAGLLSSLTPRTLAWSATAAAVMICLQAGLLTGLVVGGHEAKHYGDGVYSEASCGTKCDEGTYALISFAGNISVQEMSAFLRAHGASLLEGPKPGDMYLVKIWDKKLTGEALNTKLAEFRAQTNIVTFIVQDNSKP